MRSAADQLRFGPAESLGWLPSSDRLICCPARKPYLAAVAGLTQAAKPTPHAASIRCFLARLTAPLATPSVRPIPGHRPAPESTCPIADRWWLGSPCSVSPPQ